MSPTDLKQDIQTLVAETTTALGATDQTYIGLIQSLQKNDTLSIPNRLFQGQMVFFKYKPQNESFLSRNTYYDSFPLVLITDVYRGGFEGINLHFLIPQHRTFLFDAIMRNLPTIKASEEWRTRLMVDYDRLDASRRYRFFKPCYRRYTWSGMKRRPVVIPFQIWEDMVQSETSRFVKARATTVYRDTLHKSFRG